MFLSKSALSGRFDTNSVFRLYIEEACGSQLHAISIHSNGNVQVLCRYEHEIDFKDGRSRLRGPHRWWGGQPHNTVKVLVQCALAAADRSVASALLLWGVMK